MANTEQQIQEVKIELNLIKYSFDFFYIVEFGYR
jgi:hypothetical protein